jgi:RNA polymerase sigma-70 factor (ECF subfamily)
VLRLFRSNSAVEPKPRVVPDPLLGLARGAKAGDRAATRTLVVSLMPVLLRATRGVLGVGHPDVEDTAQEAALGLIRALTEYREDCTVGHYAARIAALTALAHRRKLKARGEGLHRELDLEAPSTCDSPADALLAARRRAILRQLCDELPSAQTEALILHCVLGMSVEEIAVSAACPTNTIKSRLRLAKEALRVRIDADPAACELLGATP